MPGDFGEFTVNIGLGINFLAGGTLSLNSNDTLSYGHTGLEGVKTQKKLTGAGIKCKKCINTIPVTTQNLKIGQRGISE